MPQTRTCTRCGELKPGTLFSKDRHATSGFSSHCKVCRSVGRRKWVRKNPDYFRNYQLKSAYGITLEEYNILVASQGGVCAICGKPPLSRSLSVDHDHRTGKVRGLLCFMCNRGLGRFRDDPELFRRAASYLERSRGN